MYALAPHDDFSLIGVAIHSTSRAPNCDYRNPHRIDFVGTSFCRFSLVLRLRTFAKLMVKI